MENDYVFTYLIAFLTILLSILFLLFSNKFKNKKNKCITLKGQNETISLKLIEKEIISHDTRRFRFALPTLNHILGLPVGQHISIKYYDNNNKLVSRSYTPVSSDDDMGFVDLVIKVYFKNVHPKFPDGGKMSQYLENLKVGEYIDISGPKGKLTYVGNGIFHIKQRINDKNIEVRKANKIGMIAGGTGITPTLQVIRKALKEKNNTIEFFILFANQTEQDILLRNELDEMEKNHKNVHVWYTIDRFSNETDKIKWKYSTGHINAEMMKNHLPPPDDMTQILICGPPPMIKFAVVPGLEELGYKDNMYFCF